jgi:hypothetical protein
MIHSARNREQQNGSGIPSYQQAHTSAYQAGMLAYGVKLIARVLRAVTVPVTTVTDTGDLQCKDTMHYVREPDASILSLLCNGARCKAPGAVAVNVNRRSTDECYTHTHIHPQ